MRQSSTDKATHHEGHAGVVQGLDGGGGANRQPGNLHSLVQAAIVSNQLIGGMAAALPALHAKDKTGEGRPVQHPADVQLAEREGDQCRLHGGQTRERTRLEAQQLQNRPDRQCVGACFRRRATWLPFEHVASGNTMTVGNSLLMMACVI